MKKILLLLLLFNINFVYSFENISIQNENDNHSSSAEAKSVISSEEFDTLEKKIFKKTFNNDLPKKRLARLEKEIFGMEQKGDDEYRFENLLTASEYYETGYRHSQNTNSNTKTKEKYEIKPKDYITNYDFNNSEQNETEPKYSIIKNSYYSANSFAEPIKKESKIKKFFSGIADVLTSGVITGYTLPMNNIIIDPLSIDNIGGNYYTGIPQFPSYYSRFPTYYSQHPYKYNRHHHLNYSRNGYYNPSPTKYKYQHRPYKNSINKRQTGGGVNIVY